MIDNAGWILGDVEFLTEAAFFENRTIQDAVLFRLLRISEAATKLGAIAENLAPEHSWQKVRSLGNALRHEYDEIALDQIWIIIRRDLPALIVACEAALSLIECSDR